ncbi:MAG TPA: sugar MFS transporter [Rhodanobacteraceae bacterium]
MPIRTASQRTALSVVTAIFFMWGFITAFNDVLIPHLKSTFTLNHAEAMLVQFVFFGAYFVMSWPSKIVLARHGYRRSIIIGLVVTGIGALLFLPAAQVDSYPFFLVAFFVLASGITLLQVAANPYVSLLGKPELGSARLNLAQALNSLGTTIAPKLGGLLILSAGVLGAAELAKLPAAQQLAYRVEQAHLVQGPYLGIAIVLFVLALIVWQFHLPAIAQAETHADVAAQARFTPAQWRRVWFGMIAIFVYVGAEVSIGSFMINYIASPDIGNMAKSHAADYVAMYWGGAMVGRFIGWFIQDSFEPANLLDSRHAWVRVLGHLLAIDVAPMRWSRAVLRKRIDPRKLLVVHATIAGLLVIATMSTHGMVAVWTVAIIGLFNSIMFPNIFALGIEKFGALTGKVSSLLVMAIVGGAVIPLAQGEIADHIGIHHAFVLPLICYAYIVFYGLKGSRVA